MTSKKRYLITTRDEHTWKFDCPVVFLGEWCRRYRRKKIWHSMDAIVAKPYGLESSIKDADYLEALKIEKNLFSDLHTLLNEEHKTNYSKRFWLIVVGHWLKSIVRELVREIKTIKKCLNQFEIFGTATYDHNLYSLTPYDFNESMSIFDYNIQLKNILYVKIIKLLNRVNFPIHVVSEKKIDQNLNFNFQQIEYLKKSFKHKLFKFAYKSYSFFSRKFVKDNDIFILNTYLPTKEEFKLELVLGQFPQLWKFQSNSLLNDEKLKKKKKIDQKKRAKMSKNLINKEYTDVEYVIRKIIMELLPVVYLEDFSNVVSKAKKQKWPKYPRLIFTSNNYYSDEIFKVWSAFQVENKNKLIIGQHGNNYGTLKYKFPRIEEIIADKFITWGWGGSLSTHTPGFIFKNSGKKNLFPDPLGDLLMILPGYTKNDCTYDKKFEYLQNLDFQKKFVGNLSKEIKKKITIRLFNENYQNEEWDEYSRWYDFDPTLDIDSGKKNIKKLINKSRLTVFNYDSTGMLETLSQNFPTIGIWPNGLDHLVDEAIPYYQKLLDAGIIYFCPKLAANKINQDWINIEKWWAQRSVQDAREYFCDHYAKISKNPSSELKRIILS